MKNLLFIILLFKTSLSFSVCINPIQRQNMSRPQSEIYNRDFNTLYSRAVDLPGDCIKDDSITGDQIFNNEIEGVKIVNGSLPLSAFAPGAIPEYSKPLKVTYYTQNSTWRKSLEVGMVFIQAVGGGGAAFNPRDSASFTPSSASSFGTHCVANGGSDSTNNTPNGAPGGISTGGDINIPGEHGKRQLMISGSTFKGGLGGRSFLGSFGLGGSMYLGMTHTVGGGGGGGYCAKIVPRSSLADEIQVTVGKGGSASNPEGKVNQGKDGVVIVFEYGR